jgi:hypothetical protein
MFDLQRNFGNPNGIDILDSTRQFVQVPLLFECRKKH